MFANHYSRGTVKLYDTVGSKRWNNCNLWKFCAFDKEFWRIKVTFARDLARKLSPLFYYLILLFQLSVANPENFEEFKAGEVLKIRKEKNRSLTNFASVMAVKTNRAKFALCTKIL